MIVFIDKKKKIIYRDKEYIAPDWVRYVVTQPTGEVYGLKKNLHLHHHPQIGAIGILIIMDGI